MIRPNPLHSLWIGFKIFTSVFAQFLGIILLVGSIVYLGSPLGLWCLVVGLFSYFFHKDLDRTMASEDKVQKDNNDEGSDFPLGAI
jgi:hypothetical protein